MSRREIAVGRAASRRRPGARDAHPPKLLVTGFGPFPGAPSNPTEALVRALAKELPEAFGAGVLKAVVLPTDYQRSWAILRGLYSTLDPDVVVHFGLNGGAKAIHIETSARNVIDPAKPDASGFASRSGRVRRSAAERLSATLPIDLILAALSNRRIAAQLSDDAGDYVCNATFYRSLHVSPMGRAVGFIHVPPESVFPRHRLLAAGKIILKSAVRA